MTPSQIRDGKNLSVARLARLADVDRSVVERLDRGESVTVASLEAVAAVLGISASALLEASQSAREEAR